MVFPFSSFTLTPSLTADCNCKTTSSKTSWFILDWSWPFFEKKLASFSFWGIPSLLPNAFFSITFCVFSLAAANAFWYAGSFTPKYILPLWATKSLLTLPSLLTGGEYKGLPFGNSFVGLPIFLKTPNFNLPSVSS